MNYLNGLLLCTVLTILSCTNNDKYQISKRQFDLNIDGLALDKDWDRVDWQQIDQLWLGELESKEDFQGRYKLIWDEDYLYVLAEIVDDTLIDTHPDPHERYWDDDCLEIFVDEDASKGNHQYNHNAFAYHIGLDGSVLDIGVDSLPRTYNQNLFSIRSTKNNISIWEVAIKLYDDNYKDGAKNTPIKLTTHKNIGFAIAYCDNDKSEERESFIGSELVKGKDKNRGWIDAGIFGQFTLTD